MFDSILQKEVQDFINSNLFSDIQKLALKKNPFPNLDYKMLLNQIVSKGKSKEKLPTWFTTDGIIYPEKISIEQTSSEKTAQYKATLVSGARLVDLTGGFGIDDYYFSKKIEKVIHCEINADLSSVTKHNFKQLGATNIECSSGDSFDFLKNTADNYDWIYIDPSRRSSEKGKVFLLADCLPNVPELLDFYFEKANRILIKTAPILDISSALRELKFVKTIHIVAVDNEVKELLFELERNYTERISIKTIDFGKTTTRFDTFLSEQTPNLQFGLPQKYLYEPNSAVMKSGSFELISSRFSLEKLHPHSHLYTSDALIDFPGRVFQIEANFAYNKENLKHYLQNQKCNITTRNFPETVENIRKKWKIKDGGNQYTFFTTDINNQKIVLLCTKIQQT
ncbi:class I SAM-dependent methyltransferase [Flavobacterium antarcticum]|uniref:class I SAM-dependent methyltransferase n=1 Tax=Flavobacterium antarcticum TaxID=271155 RepID=UPI0003B47D77|nr:class I SAM-dependent methyltransferase [Flavobacterium antarcticum]